MNRTSEGTPPGVLPTAGSALDDAALSGPGSYLHGAVVVDSRPTLLAVALPYLEQGLSVGDLTVLSCAPETVELVRRELGVRARGLEADPGLTLLGTRSADVFTHLRQYAHRAGLGGSSRLRVLAEVASPADPRAQHEEMRVESVANRIMAELPVTALCVYDARRLPGELVASARETHPYLVDGASWTASPALRDPDSFVRALPVPREPLEDTPPLIAVEAAPTLPELRHRLTGPLTALVGDEEQCEDLKLGIKIGRAHV